MSEACSCPDPLREVSAFCPLHGHSPDLRYPPNPTPTERESAEETS